MEIACLQTFRLAARSAMSWRSLVGLGGHINRSQLFLDAVRGEMVVIAFVYKILA